MSGCYNASPYHTENPVFKHFSPIAPLRHSMISILSLRYPKSGNVWLNYLLRSAVESATGQCRQAIAGHPAAEVLDREEFGIRGQNNADSVSIEPLGVFFNIAEVFKWPIADMKEYASRTNLVLCHSPWDAECAGHYKAFSHRILILRDPRDIAVSFSRFMFTPFNQLHAPTPFSGPDELLAARFSSIVQAWVDHTVGHLLRGHADARPHVVFYERLVADTAFELEKIVRYLALDLSDETIGHIAADHQLERTRERQPDHVFRGGWGNWLGFLDDRQIFAASRIAGTLMEALGYPISRTEAPTWGVAQLRDPRRPAWRTGTTAA